MDFNQYKKITFNSLMTYVAKEWERYGDDKKNPPVLCATAMGKSVNTIKLCVSQETQVVSDETFTKFFSVIGLDGFIVNREGEKFYYIKK
jgi:hypothetical protein